MSGPLRTALSYLDRGYHKNVIISNHALIHTGMTYTAGHSQDDVADAASIELSILTGANYEAHLEIHAVSEGKAILEVYENRTITGGTTLDPRNKNRSLTRAADGGAVTTATLDALCQEVVKYAPATSSGGTLLMSQKMISSGVGATTAVATGGSRNEWILAPSTQYTVILTNDAGTAKDLALGFEWYEHPRNSQQAPEVLD